MKTRWLMFGLLFLSLPFAACNGSCDDDDDNNDDSSPEPYGWPDNPGPVEGWFATWQASGWELFRIANNLITLEEGPGNELFIGGALANTHQGLAVSADHLYKLTEEGWNFLLDGPPCEYFFSQPFLNDNGDIVIGCADPAERWYRIENIWQSIPFTDVAYFHMSCLNMDRCMFWRDDAAVVCSRLECEGITELPFGEYKQFVWRDTNRLYALLLDYDGEDSFSYPYQYDLQTKKWKEETRVAPNGESLFTRINEEYVVYSQQIDPEVYILDGDDGLVEHDWPFLYRMIFAPGGGGIGISADGFVQLIGTDYLPLAAYPGGYMEDFFVVADAE
ncbi:MAG: hypothetical protein GX444_06045 [Myxococcales bacterium]|nr:hypothetical protein [Myxococcales bacterium]